MTWAFPAVIRRKVSTKEVGPDITKSHSFCFTRCWTLIWLFASKQLHTIFAGSSLLRQKLSTSHNWWKWSSCKNFILVSMNLKRSNSIARQTLDLDVAYRVTISILGSALISETECQTQSRSSIFVIVTPGMARVLRREFLWIIWAGCLQTRSSFCCSNYSVHVPKEYECKLNCKRNTKCR